MDVLCVYKQESVFAATEVCCTIIMFSFTLSLLSLSLSLSYIVSVLLHFPGLEIVRDTG